LIAAGHPDHTITKGYRVSGIEKLHIVMGGFYLTNLNAEVIRKRRRLSAFWIPTVGLPKP